MWYCVCTAWSCPSRAKHAPCNSSVPGFSTASACERPACRRAIRSGPLWRVLGLPERLAPVGRTTGIPGIPAHRGLNGAGSSWTTLAARPPHTAAEGLRSLISLYLDDLRGSVFSYHGGRYAWTWPREWPFPISIHFGPPVRNPQDVYPVRRAVQDLGAKAVRERSANMPFVTPEFIRSCKNQKRKAKVADSFARGTHRRLLAHAVVDPAPVGAALRAGCRRAECGRPAPAECPGDCGQRGVEPRPTRGRQSELHRLPGSHAGMYRPGWHPTRVDQPQGDREVWLRVECRTGHARGSARRGHAVGQVAQRAGQLRFARSRADSLAGSAQDHG